MYLNTRRLAVSAVMTALAVVFMLISSYVPTMRLAFAAAACLCTTVVVAETGPLYALISYAACAVLSLLFAPVTGILYAGLLGWYPSAKCVMERIGKLWLSWAVKAAVIALAVSLLFTLASNLAGALFPKLASLPAVLIVAAVAAMLVFDVFLTKFIGYYVGSLRPKIIKNR